MTLHNCPFWGIGLTQGLSLLTKTRLHIKLPRALVESEEQKETMHKLQDRAIYMQARI